ncbi:MAG: cobyric acid synthase CobQ, partial [Rhodospirillales bacterium]|nr:cobyric acid synthase CobQ [Rhodospirillales bacterium]
GQSQGPDAARPFAHVRDRMGERPDGAVSADGLVMGSYLHGLFHEDAFRTAFLASLGAEVAARAHGAEIEAALDGLAAHLEIHLDVDGLFSL